MKIAAVYDDGLTISQHSGHALLYMVITVEEDKAIGWEIRKKIGPTYFVEEHPCRHGHSANPHSHGFDHSAQTRHAQMIEAIADCHVLLAQSISAMAYESLRQACIHPIVPNVICIDDAVQAYLKCKLEDLPKWLH